jgi:hypothetical protein
LDPSQWLQIKSSIAPTSNRRWSELTSTCTGLVTGLNYLFIIAETGEKRNPQKKIILVEPTYTTTDVSMRSVEPSPSFPSLPSPRHHHHPVRVPSNDESTEQTIELLITISFISFGNEKLKEYTPPPPPGLLTVPYDIFYPFIGNSAPALIDSKGTVYRNCILSVLGSVLFFIYLS